MAGQVVGSSVLAPYVSRLAVDWIRGSADVRYRTVTGTLVFADISGFTRLTERLAAKGRIGAEEMSDHLDRVLSALLDASAAYDGWLVKWGGDALLLMFDGDDNAARACAASADMRAVIADVGRLDTSVGRVRLRMSVGINSGTFEFLLVGDRHRELLVTGDAATVTATLEATAEAGDILMSPDTAALLPGACRGEPKGDGILLAATPFAMQSGWSQVPVLDDEVLTRVLPPLVAEHLLAGGGSGEHRAVAIGFVEFRGVGELRASRGPAGLVEALDHLATVTQRACERFSVSFHESDIGPNGGKFLLVAGAPRTVDDPCEAMLCVAREVVDNPGLLTVRVGVTTGRVFSGAVGPSYRRSYSVKGDVVNLAARVMGKTAPGQIWAIPGVVEASRTQFDLTEVEPFMVKGKKNAVSAYAVGPPVSRGRADSELPLIGRIGEVASIWAASVHAESGNGAVIELIGDAGSGKTRMLAETQHLAHNFGVISVAAEPYRSASAYALAGQVVAAALGLGTGTPEAMRARLETWCDARAPELAPWLPLLGTVVGVDLPDTPETQVLDERFRPTHIERTVLDALTAALPEPTVLCVDDAQFADEASTGILRAIAADIGTRRWLLIVAHRPNDTAPLAPGIDRIELGALPEDESRALVAADTREAPLSGHMTTEVVMRGGGNPMFLRELVRAAHDVHSADLLPDSIENIVIAQIADLAPPDRDVLRTASVIGMTVDPDLLADVLDLADGGQLRIDSLHAFIGAEGTNLRFRQALLHDAAYAGLPFRRRAELHGRVADALLARGQSGGEYDAALSLHLLNAERFADAMATARAAAERSASAYANVEAERLYERAVTAARKVLGRSAPEVAEMLESLADVRVRLGEFGTADSTYAAARRLRHDDPVAVARIGLKSARSASQQGNYALTSSRVRRAQAALGSVEAPGAHRLRLDLEMRAGYTEFRRGRLAAARATCSDLVEHTDEASAPDIVAEALGVLDLAELGLGLPADPTRAERALGLYARLGNLSDEARLLNQMGYRAYFAGRWTEALDLYARARDLFARTGDVPNAAVADANIAEILVDQGRSVEAEESLRSALHTWRAAGAWNDAAFAYSLLGRVLARQGQYDDARAALDEARTHFAAQGARTEVVDADTYRAELLLLEGKTAEALGLADATLAAAATLSDLPAQAPLLHRIVAACLDLTGDTEAATREYVEALTIARQRAAAHDIAFTLTAMATRARTAGVEPDPAWLTEATELRRALGLVIDVTDRRVTPSPQPAITVSTD